MKSIRVVLIGITLGIIVVIFAVLIGFNFMEFNSVLSKIKGGQTGNALIVTKQGYYLAQKANDKELKLKITDEKDENLKKIGDEIVSRNVSGVLETVIDGQQQYAVYAPIGITGMKIVMFLPISETSTAFNFTDYLFKNILIFVFFMIAVIIIGYFLLNWRVVNPLMYVSRKISLIASGDLTVDFEKNNFQ